MLALGIFFPGIGLRGLWTGSIRETTNPPGFDGWLWFTRSESDYHDRDTDPFRFWLTFIFATAVGVGMIFMSIKMSGMGHQPSG